MFKFKGYTGNLLLSWKVTKLFLFVWDEWWFTWLFLFSILISQGWFLYYCRKSIFLNILVQRDQNHSGYTSLMLEWVVWCASPLSCHKLKFYVQLHDLFNVFLLIMNNSTTCGVHICSHPNIIGFCFDSARN